MTKPTLTPSASLVFGLLLAASSILQAQVVVTTLTDEDNGNLGSTVGDGTSLREAIKYSSTGGLVTFAPALDGQTITLSHPAGQLLITKSLTIDASSLLNGLTIDANKQSRIIETEPNTTLDLHGLILTKGVAQSTNFDITEGGAIYNDRAILSLNGCTLSDNVAVEGGAIYNRSLSTVILSDCILSGNSATSGGGIYSTGRSATLTLSDCTLSKNSASWGGGIYNRSNSNLSLSNCTLSGNTAARGGGGICNVDSSNTLTLVGCKLSNNSAFSGGGIYSEAVWGDNLILDFSSCNFSDNSALSGGGIYHTSDRSTNVTLNLNACVLSGNSASWEGGGIYSESESSSSTALNLTSCNLTNNSTELFDGGGILSTTSVGSSETLTLNFCTLANNSAASSGGGINGSGVITLDLNSCTLSGNSADSGGAISSASTLRGNANVSLNNCTLTNNSANSYGGGISTSGRLTSATLSLNDCTLSTNSAYSGGGGIYTDGSRGGSSILSLSNTILAENTAPTGPDLLEFDDNENGSATTTAIGNNLMSSLAGSNIVVAPAEITILTAPLNLAPLGDYGGPTQTMPPIPGSPAIDTAGATDPGGTDQRGEPRFAGGSLDIGAVEIQSTTDTCNIFAIAWETDQDHDGSPFGVEFALGTNPAKPDPKNLQNFQFDFDANDHPNLEFGYNPEAIGKAIWIIERSTDLDNWNEIFRSTNPDNGADNPVSGIDELINAATSVELFDNNISPSAQAPDPRIFYRFRADLPTPPS